jgi:hypothetical protein
MKANKIKNLAICLVLFQASCIDLDTAPYDRETDLTFWEDDSLSALKAVNTCYQYLSSMDEQLWSEAMTDNAYTKQPTAYTQSIGNGSFSTADNYVQSVWDFRYAGIHACNEVLDNIDQTPHLSAVMKNRIIGEAKFVRAYCYYELYTKFGDIPYFTNVISVAESQKISRTPREEVVTNILKELDEIISNNYLPESYASLNKGRITKWAAMALKSKVFLFESNWSKVKELTDKIMSQGGYSLFPSYSGLFEVANEGNDEIILDIQYEPTSREHQMMYSFLPPSMGGYSQLSPLQSLVDSYIMLDGKAINEAGSGYDETKPYENRDPRLAATIMYTGNSYIKADGSEQVINCHPNTQPDGFGYSSDCTATGYYVKKYWDNTYRANLYSGLNTILIRYADILLMNAEACAATGTLDKAEWDRTIKPIRARAGFTSLSALEYPSGKSKDELIQIVRNERRCELAMEGLRHKDIMRWRIADKVLNGWCHGFYTGETVGTDNGYVRVENRKFDANKHYLWPIPQHDRDLNSNLTQNPNW